MTAGPFKPFAIGLFVLTLGCKAGSALKFAGVAAVTTARVAQAAAVARAAEGSSRPSAQLETTTVSTERVAFNVVSETGMPFQLGQVPCEMLCVAMVDNRVVYVCADPVPGVDSSGRHVTAFVCK